MAEEGTNSTIAAMIVAVQEAMAVTQQLCSTGIIPAQYCTYAEAAETLTLMVLQMLSPIITAPLAADAAAPATDPKAIGQAIYAQHLKALSGGK